VAATTETLEARLSAALAERDALRTECESFRGDLEHLQDQIKLRDSALDATTAHLLIADVRRRGWPIVYVNRAIAADHGYEPGELLGRSPVSLNPPELNELAVEELNQGMRQGKIVRAQVVSQRKDGSTFWSGITLAPVRDIAGDVTHYLGMGTDITARLQEQERARELQTKLTAETRERERISAELRLAQKLESVGRLAAGIAHEINTPIQYIGDSVLFLQSAQAELERALGACCAAFERIAGGEWPNAPLESLREALTGADLEFLSSEIPKAFERTLEGVERVAGIVRAMKEFAHPGEVEQSAADLNHAIQTTLIVARNEYKYSAQVETRLGALPEVMCNIGELNQVLLNLIVNAAHAIVESGKDTASGRIVIATEQVREQVRISISDNGCGIPKQNLEKIFDPFFTTKEVGRGTGQGLAIARSIVVEKHGGHIDVRSEPGAGTTFILSLPIGGCAARAAA
jgi:two-component system NtrC family sensor kinase